MTQHQKNALSWLKESTYKQDANTHNDPNPYVTTRNSRAIPIFSLVTQCTKTWFCLQPSKTRSPVRPVSGTGLRHLKEDDGETLRHTSIFYECSLCLSCTQLIFTPTRTFAHMSTRAGGITTHITRLFTAEIKNTRVLEICMYTLFF